MLIEENFVKDGEKMMIYHYSSKHLTKTEKVKYYYALKGRDGKTGIVKALNLCHIGKGVILAPFRHGDDVEQLFKVWNISFLKRNAIVGKEVFGGGHY